MHDTPEHPSYTMPNGSACPPATRFPHDSPGSAEGALDAGISLHSGTPPPVQTDRADSSRLAAALAQRCHEARATGDGWQACCPAHQDTTPSLTITSTHDRVLVHCHAGCEPEAILHALGMTFADLFALSPSPNGYKHIVQVYDYVDATGTLVHQTVRYAPKAFRQRRPDPAHPGAYLWNLRGIEPVLYHLPAVLTAVQRGEVVYLVEGEHDVETVQALGLVATCNPMGAGKWRPSYSDTLRGAAVVLLPDNDAPGRQHVRQVVQALHGVAARLKIVPLPGLPEKGDISDWLTAGRTRADLEALVETIPWEVSPSIFQDATPDEPSTSVPGVQTDQTVPLRTRFYVDTQGVWFTPPRDAEGTQPPAVWVCAPLHIVAATCDTENDHHGHLLEFSDRHGHPQQWAMPLELLEEPREYRKVLRRRGLVMNSNAQKLLQLYLDVWRAGARARCVDRIGWHGPAYVLPDTTLGASGDERLVLQTLDPRSEGYRQAGTLEGWRTEIAARCLGNSRLLVAVSTGFAAPLLALLHEESGGLHFRGVSSEGKTTALLVAATVWGEPGRLERWRTTANALEGVALAHNDNLLCLDELKELDPREAGGVAYMLANGAGKRRGQAHGGTRPRLLWRLLFLSTGEMSLEQHIAEAGQRSYAGQEVRLVEIPADAGASLGLFENLHGTVTGQAFADQLRAATSRQYGQAGRAFVAILAQDWTSHAAQARQLREAFVTEQVAAGASGQVYRVAQRFGLIGAGGELATAAGLTGWPAGDALAAAARCFQDWLQHRGGIGNAEEVRALSQVRLFFEQYGEARFTPWTLRDGATCERCHGSGQVAYSSKQGSCFDCHGTGSITSASETNRPISQRAGFRRATEDGRTEFYVFPEVFRYEIGKSFESQWLAQTLIKHDLLYRAPDGKLQDSCRLPSVGRKRVYHFKAEILGENAGDDPMQC